MSSLSRSARTTTAPRRRCACAASSSATSVGVCSDQPRTSEWPRSTTVDWPRWSSVSRSVIAVVTRPTSVET
ncbi:hypothetical protein [Streptomyces sp. NPDC046371]|uniref:hypothetical protein n=1 Tax=Streptomyces sp. NPDC046371 TaxID=3154916 RepID=UPI0033E559CF